MLDLTLIEAFMYELRLSVVILSPSPLLIAILLLPLGRYLLSCFILVLRLII